MSKGREDAPRTARRSPNGAIQAAFFAAIPTLLVVAGWLRRWTADDGFIYVRVVQNVLAGNGAVYNAGERIETATDPIWVYLVSLVRLVLAWMSIEYVMVLLSLVLAAVAAIAMQLASWRLWTDRSRLFVPFGVVVVGSVAAYWDFATSGLDTALVLAWIGTTTAGMLWLSPLLEAERPGRRTTLLAVVLGLGWLIRPDLAPFAGLLTVALVVVVGVRNWRRWAVLVSASLALPATYLVFRAGYYGALLPTSAIAKGTDVRWAQGMAFLTDLVARYALLVPLVLIAVAAVLGMRRLDWVRGRADRTIVIALVFAAAIQAIFIIRLGGGFMHGRLLLPALFAFCLPLAVVPWHRELAVPVLSMAAWGIVAIVGLRPYFNAGPNGWIVDERAFYVALSGVENPVEIDDLGSNPWRLAGEAFSQRAAEVEQATLSLPPEDTRDFFYIDGYEMAASPGSMPFRFAVSRRSIGIPAAAASLDVHIIDHLGLADPIAARMIVEVPDRPGHEKVYPVGWVVARFAAEGERLPDYVEPSDVEAAHAVLECSAAGGLIEGVTQPLTVRRFLSNVVNAAGWTFLRIPPNPEDAAALLCNSR